MPIVIFVGGITGSGKSTTCQWIARGGRGTTLILGLGEMACKLAREQRLATVSIEGASQEALDEVQRLLAVEIVQVLRRTHASHVLLDGHFVLALHGHHIYRVPLAFFKTVGVNGIVLCDPDAETHRRQVLNDAVRQRPGLILDDVDRFLREERGHGNFVAADLSVPILVSRGTETLTVVEVDAFVQKCACSCLQPTGPQTINPLRTGHETLFRNDRNQGAPSIDRRIGD